MFIQSATLKKIAGISLLSLALGACNLPSDPDSAASSESQGKTGKAIIRLPAFPAGSLAKASNQSGPVFGFTLVLDITIPSRKVALTHRWDLHTFNGPLVVDHIPEGAAEFAGRLVTATGEVTHSGSVTVEIQANQIVDVDLYLKSLSVGDAAICVDVEGLPSSGCAISNPVSLRDLSTCWAMHRILSNGDPEAGILRVHSDVGAGTEGDIEWDWNTAVIDAVSNIWADVKWGMAGFTTSSATNGGRSYQGAFQQDNSIRFGTIQNANGFQIGTFTATPIACPD